MIKLNYLEGLIENLGVVPLFLFAAFLFLPVFFALLLRMAFVCFVFDAIWAPCVFRALRFHNILCFVKASIIIFPTILCAAQDIPKNIYLAKGEQVSIPAPNLEQFSVGNPEILGRRYSPRSKEIFIKGKKMGYSDVVIWSKGKSITYHAYVLSKTQNLKLAQVANTLKDLGLAPRFEGKQVWAKGTLENLEQLSRVLRLKEDYQKQLQLQLEISPELQKQVIAEIYLYFHRAGIKIYHCKVNKNFPECFYQAAIANIKIEKEILKLWGIKLHFQSDGVVEKNLKVQFKFLEIESQETEDFALGIQELTSTVKNFLNSHKALYENNSIQLNGNSYNMKLLAEPEVQSVIDQKNKIQIGVNIPYQSKTREGEIQTEWVETGLKIDFTLKMKHGKVLLDYASELSSPSVEQIKTNEQSGSFYPRFNDQYSQIFQIGLNTQKKQHSGPLLIRNIPLIGPLLSSHSHLKSYKYFLGFIKIDHD